jgi:hypothetical protein
MAGGIAESKIADVAGEAMAADAGVLRDVAPAKRTALLACMVHVARTRARDRRRLAGTRPGKHTAMAMIFVIDDRLLLRRRGRRSRPGWWSLGRTGGMFGQRHAPNRVIPGPARLTPSSPPSPVSAPAIHRRGAWLLRVVGP